MVRLAQGERRQRRGDRAHREQQRNQPGTIGEVVVARRSAAMDGARR
ncbi:hypothetical protein ACIBI9_39150 [Nonomuraea sp. NPDC050451]